jgi:hypothetical protein
VVRRGKITLAAAGGKGSGGGTWFGHDGGSYTVTDCLAMGPIRRWKCMTHMSMSE